MFKFPYCCAILNLCCVCLEVTRCSRIVGWGMMLKEYLFFVRKILFPLHEISNCVVKFCCPTIEPFLKKDLQRSGLSARLVIGASLFSDSIVLPMFVFCRKWIARREIRSEENHLTSENKKERGGIMMKTKNFFSKRTKRFVESFRMWKREKNKNKDGSTCM